MCKYNYNQKVIALFFHPKKVAVGRWKDRKKVVKVSSKKAPSSGYFGINSKRAIYRKSQETRSDHRSREWQHQGLAGVHIS